MAGTEEIGDLETTLSNVAVALFAAGSVTSTLQKIADLAATAIDGCDAAAIMLVHDGSATTVAASSALAHELDEVQINAHEGPCLHAAVNGTTSYAADLIDDSRWPTFRLSAVAAGIRSVLAYSLSAERASALNLYAALPAAFGAIERAQAHLFTTLARLALDTAEKQATSDRDYETLTGALHTREIIGQAQGILMERERITADQAFTLMRKASQRLNVKLRDVAQDLVDTGENPTPNGSGH